MNVNERLRWIAILVIVSAILFTLISLLPLRIVHVEGRITDFIGGDNGFGLKIDDTAYWLSYGGYSNFSFSSSMIGKRCSLIYVTNLLCPNSVAGFYARTIHLRVFDGE